LSERVNREEEEEINAKAQRRKVAKGRQEREGRRGEEQGARTLRVLTVIY
jgi:hypothetical protein